LAATARADLGDSYGAAEDGFSDQPFDVAWVTKMTGHELVRFAYRAQLAKSRFAHGEVGV
jgi:hypothetical protein